MLTYDVAKIFKKPHEFEKFLERMNLYLHCICFFCQIFLLKILTKLVILISTLMHVQYQYSDFIYSDDIFNFQNK